MKRLSVAAAAVCAPEVLGAHGRRGVAGHVIGHGAHLGPRRLAPLLAMCYMISMGSSPVKIPVTVRHFRLYTSESYLT